MNLGMVFSAMLIALSFTMWPIIGKYSGAVAAWVATMVSLGTLLAVTVLSGNTLTVLPSGRILLFLLCAGVVNGIGLHFYTMRTSDPETSTAVFMVMTATMMVVTGPILDRALNGTAFNFRQIIGFGTATLTVYLLSR